MNEAKSSLKDKARVARLLLEAAKALKQVLKEVSTVEGIDSPYQARQAVPELIELALSVPGLRLALFADDEGGKDGDQAR